jgi:hypothetical protein
VLLRLLDMLGSALLSKKSRFWLWWFTLSANR